jgi:4-amino-4-deoxy-L-arabinose transferase
MWATFGLGFLTKGPPALLPLLPILAVARWSARKATTPTLIDAPSALAFFVLGPAWFIWLVSQRPELLGYFLGHEFIDRIFSGVHGRNAQWYGAITVYLPALLLAAFPWGLYTALQWLRRDRTAGRATGEPVFRAAWQRRLLWAWLLIPLTVFVIAQSRLVLYVVPLAVPLALLIARALDTHWRTPLPRGVVVALCVWAGAALAVKGATTSLESTKDARALAAQLAQLAPDARRLVFVDAKARHGLRFYLDLPVEQVGSTVANVPVAHGQRGHLLCDELELSPGLVAIGHGTLLGDGARRAARPTCPGWVFATPRMGSGVWIPRAATPGPSPAS